MSETTRLTFPIHDLAERNEDFRKVVWTGEQTQIVLMAIPENSEIGGETHEGHDQLLFFVAGTGIAKIGDTEMKVAAGDVSVVPSGKFHNFKNTGPGMLKLFTTYSPPEHDAGTVHETKDEAEAH